MCHSTPRQELVLPLKELLVSKGVTSLFVHTVDADLVSPIRESFDHSIRSRHLLLPNVANTRIGYQVLTDGRKVRIARRTGAVIE